MIRVMSELPPGVLGFEARGKVTGRDYETVLMPEINRVVGEGRKLRVLYWLGPEFEGFSVAAMFDDALMGLGHGHAWQRAAVVSDVAWIGKAFGPFARITPMAMRLYPNAELEAAVAWVSGEVDE